MFKKILSKILGSRNAKLLKSYQKRVPRINALEGFYKGLDDEQLKNEFSKIREQVENGASLNSVLESVFAIVREASVRTLKMRHFDVQLIGGMVLHDGQIAEMKTGEGKTLVATLAVCLNALSGKSVHVVTVNDYLARRDAETLAPLYNFLGFSVGIITAAVRDDAARKQAYSANVVYATNNELGFDYLRDNMKYAAAEKVQRDHGFAIVDEVDSILIDEARTPLIISGPVSRQMEHYALADSVARKLLVERDFSIDEKNRVIMLTEEGVSNAEKLFGVENLYNIENAGLSHHLDQALKANYLFSRDKDYVVREGANGAEVVIVDEFTGRLSEGRRFSEGLHQALEAKEKVAIKEESQTLADITFQNYFRLYEKLSGMTGTAQTEASEFLQIYNLEVISIPTNVPVVRRDLNDLIYKSEREKFDAVVAKIKELYHKGQPVLVGTASIEKSEVLHGLLKSERIPHTVLNAKQHDKEAEIIKDAGLKGAVTIATNMAGRGVDIKINDEVRDLGGLYIIGTERHESRRIDNQLRGRSGRQGDPGTSQFYLSLEDSLLRIFGSDKIKGIMEKLGLKDGEHIESGLVTRSVENAQKKVENLHFESRKHILEYDDVANEQRKAVYKLRNELLSEGYNIADKIETNRAAGVANLVGKVQAAALEDESVNTLERVRALCLETYGIDVTISGVDKHDFDAISEMLSATLKQDYENKMSALPAEHRNEIERIIYLQILDNLWREHLYTMDNLKTGIGLRGYNQKDPLIEYKKESYALFLEFIENLKLESIRALQIMRFRAQDAQTQADELREEMKKADENLVLGGGDSAGFDSARGSAGDSVGVAGNSARGAGSVGAGGDSNGGGSVGDSRSGGFRVEKKVARNDPCPCGSGKKYKLCHGKSGPKKGLLA